MKHDVMKLAYIVAVLRPLIRPVDLGRDRESVKGSKYSCPTDINTSLLTNDPSRGIAGGIATLTFNRSHKNPSIEGAARPTISPAKRGETVLNGVSLPGRHQQCGQLEA